MVEQSRPDDYKVTFKGRGAYQPGEEQSGEAGAYERLHRYMNVRGAQGYTGVTEAY